MSRVPPVRNPRDATDALQIDARPVCESVVLRTIHKRLWSEMMLTLPEARRLKKQLDDAILKAERFKKTGKI